MRSPWPILAVGLMAGACSSIPGSDPTHPILPAGNIQLTRAASISASGLVMGSSLVAAGYFIVDPLAPNWEIKETRLQQREYQLSLRMKAFTSGGDGEARQIFQRRATALAREGGFGTYQILSYTEGLESTTFPAPHQVAEGVIRLVPGNGR